MFQFKNRDMISWIKNTWKKFLSALPVISFFLFLFFTVIKFFGMKSIMAVTIATVLFKVNYSTFPPV